MKNLYTLLFIFILINNVFAQNSKVKPPKSSVEHIKSVVTQLYHKEQIRHFKTKKKRKATERKMHEKIGHWYMNYYKNPNPKLLLKKFNCVKRSYISNCNLESISFLYSSALRNNPKLLDKFYNKFSDKKNIKIKICFIYSLYLVNSKKSKWMLLQYKNKEKNPKRKSDIERLLKKEPTDIYMGQFQDDNQLDMLWADFFITGNEKPILKIITLLNQAESKSSELKTKASAAKWSLSSNILSHKKIYDIILKYSNHPSFKHIRDLKDILNRYNKEKMGSLCNTEGNQ